MINNTYQLITLFWYVTILMSCVVNAVSITGLAPCDTINNNEGIFGIDT